MARITYSDAQRVTIQEAAAIARQEGKSWKEARAIVEPLGFKGSPGRLWKFMKTHGSSTNRPAPRLKTAKGVHGKRYSKEDKQTFLQIAAELRSKGKGWKEILPTVEKLGFRGSPDSLYQMWHNAKPHAPKLARTQPQKHRFTPAQSNGHAAPAPSLESAIQRFVDDRARELCKERLKEFKMQIENALEVLIQAI